MGKRYVIASGHPATTEAARHALEAGGNAFDAALAGWLASCLAEPVLTSPGGGGFAMASPGTGRPRLYDFFAQTPVSPNPNGHTYPLEADFGTTRQVFHLGAGSIATPGAVAGILRMQSELGRLPFHECAAPARHLSKEGLAVTPHAETLLTVVNDLYLATPDARSLFASRLQGDRCLLEGEIFLNKDFGAFLDMLEAEGPRWFYEGDIGRIVSDYCRDHEGHLSREDFVSYRVEVRDPLVVRRNGSTIWLNPPPSMGGTLIALGLAVSDPAGPDSYPFNHRAGWENWYRPLRLMTLLRTREGLRQLHEDEIEAVREVLQQDARLEAAFSEALPHAWDHLHATGTTQISVMDAEGNELSMTTSNGAGSAIIPRGTGFMLNNMLGEEDLQPDGLHTWKPNRRLASMMAPCLAHLADGSRVATGSGGSNRIRSTVLQILRHLIDRHAPLEAAVDLPRLHWENGQLHAETAAVGALLSPAAATPWPVIGHPMPNLFFGGAHSVACSRDGSFTGIGDPRRGGTAAVR